MSIDAQRARNACFPDCAGSPLILLTFMAAVNACLALLHFPGSPLADLVPTFAAVMAHLQELLPEVYGAMGLSEVSFNPPTEMPSQVAIQREVETLRSELDAAIAGMINWRLDISSTTAQRHYLRLWCARCTLDELEYHDSWPPPLRMIQAGLGAIEVAMERAGPILPLVGITPGLDHQPPESSQ